MDSKRRFRLRGQTVPDNPSPKKKNPLTGKVSRRRTREVGIPEGQELNLVPFYELGTINLRTAREAAEAYADELRRQGITEHAEWAVNAVADALSIRRMSVVHRLMLREMGVAEADEVVPMPDTGNVTFDPETNTLTIPDVLADNMSMESEAEGLLQNMVRQRLNREQMDAVLNNLQEVQPQRREVYTRARARVELYWRVVEIGDARQAGRPMSPLQIIESVTGVRSRFSAPEPARGTEQTQAVTGWQRNPIDPPIRRAPRQVDPIVRNAARPRAAPRGGVPPAMMQQSERRLEQRMVQFREECADLRDQVVRLTNAGQATDAQNILDQFHAYGENIGSFPEVGPWRETARAFYDQCWNVMFENRMRYDGSRGVRRINRRKP